MVSATQAGRSLPSISTARSSPPCAATRRCGASRPSTSICASSHRAHAEWSPSRLIRWAEKIDAALTNYFFSIGDQENVLELTYNQARSVSSAR